MLNNQKIIKVGIIGAQPGGNKGAEAMLTNLIENLSTKYVCKIFCEVTSQEKLNSPYLEEYRSSFGSNVSLHYFLFKVKKIFFSIPRSLKNVDFFIDIHGLSFTDKSPKGNIRLLIRYISIFRLRKKIIFFTQDIGPLNRVSSKFIARLAFKLVGIYFFPRSITSRNIFINKLKLENLKVTEPFPDSAITLAPQKIDKLKLPEKFILVAPSILLHKKFGEQYIKKMIMFINKLKDSEQQIVYLNHDFSTDTYNDGLVCNELTRSLPGLIVNENYKSQELKFIISLADVVITSRYHVAVAALSSNTLPYIWGWNKKYYDLCELYKLDKNFLIDLDTPVDNVTYNETLDIYNDFMIKKNLEIKSKVIASYNYLFNIINRFYEKIS